MYVPESEPFVQVRVCEAQVAPTCTNGVWYAVTDAPFTTVVLLKEQEVGGMVPETVMEAVPATLSVHAPTGDPPHPYMNFAA